MPSVINDIIYLNSTNYHERIFRSNNINNLYFVFLKIPDLFFIRLLINFRNKSPAFRLILLWASNKRDVIELYSTEEH